MVRKITVGICCLLCFGVGIYFFFKVLQEPIYGAAYFGPSPDLYDSAIMNLPRDMYCLISGISLLVSFYLFKKIR